MGSRLGFRWLIGLLVVAMLVVAGVYGYNIGVAHGLAESGQFAAAPGPGAPAVAFYPRPWGFGFGFFPFFPLLFILFWFAVVRSLFWRGGWYGRRGCGYGGYRGVPPAFEEWHRRAHEQGAPPETQVKA